jgi:hypothetical protein
VSVRAALVTGTVLSLVTVSGAAALDPGRAAVHLSPGQPLASYRSLADAPSGNGLELFALVAFLFFACLLVTGMRHARRRTPAGYTAPDPHQGAQP